MNSLNPANVPACRDAQWVYSVSRPISKAQTHTLQEWLKWEGVKASDLFGEGFSSLQDLSSWAAHWAITLLESRAGARMAEEYRRDLEARRDQQVKRMISDIYLNRHPELRPRYVR